MRSLWSCPTWLLLWSKSGRASHWIAGTLIITVISPGSIYVAAAQVIGSSPQVNGAEIIARSGKTGFSLWLRNQRKYALNHIGSRGIGAEANLYSLGQERVLGRKIARDIETDLRLVADLEVNNYVNRIVQNIVRHSDAKIPVTVKIVDEDEVAAYSLPGGIIYVNSGLVLAVDDEASLACILAHEVAHVAARHGTQTFTRTALFATVPLKFQRDLEREADLLAIEYTYAAGYDPEALGQFFEKIRRLNLVSVTPDHPALGERIKRAQIEIATMLPEKTAYVVTTSELDQVKTRLMALTNHRGPGGNLATSHGLR